MTGSGGNGVCGGDATASGVAYRRKCGCGVGDVEHAAAGRNDATPKEEGAGLERSSRPSPAAS